MQVFFPGSSIDLIANGHVAHRDAERECVGYPCSRLAGQTASVAGWIRAVVRGQRHINARREDDAIDEVRKHIIGIGCASTEGRILAIGIGLPVIDVGPGAAGPANRLDAGSLEGVDDDIAVLDNVIPGSHIHTQNLIADGDAFGGCVHSHCRIAADIQPDGGACSCTARGSGNVHRC